VILHVDLVKMLVNPLPFLDEKAWAKVGYLKIGVAFFLRKLGLHRKMACPGFQYAVKSKGIVFAPLLNQSQRSRSKRRCPYQKPLMHKE